MKVVKLYSLLTACSLMAVVSCSDSPDLSTTPQVPVQAQPQVSVFDQLKSETKPGPVNIYDMPEMLTLSIMDSAALQDMAFKLAKDYSVIEEEAKAIGAEIESPGVINYNNDPANFKFECLLLIKKIPAKEPMRCKIVALEATKMFVYNYYGPYDDLVGAYDKIRAYFKEHKLTQSGPMREFYITDPTAEKDPSKWLTQIMVPIN